MNLHNIRNFVITAHIDHGKSTLADRLLELTGTVPKEKLREQYLDQNPIERERGITIKLAPVRMNYTQNAIRYSLNLIDTPGHIDFSYEVSRSLAAVEGAILLVDATAGVQAQTVSNVVLAREQNLTVIPVVNKIDLPNASQGEVAKQIIETFGFQKEELLFVSAKTGENVPLLLEAIVKRVPSPKASSDAPLKALIFDSQYEKYKGIIAHVRIFEGTLKEREEISFLGSGATAPSVEVGIFSPELVPTGILTAGEIGYVATGLKDVARARVGDTITLGSRPTQHPIPGYKEAKPMVFAAFYSIDNHDFPLLKDALTKLKLSDASLSFDAEFSHALGNGFRIGFLGILHRDIVQERLEREYGLSLIASLPTVEYSIETTKGENLWIRRPNDLPNFSFIKQVKEPIVEGKITSPKLYVGGLLELIAEKRGSISNMTYQGEQVTIDTVLPLSEIIIDFYDRLKNISSGFASFDYNISDYRTVEVVKLDILVAHEPVDALSQIVVSEKVQSIGRRLVDKLKEVIPRQQFPIAIQASVGSKIIARVNIPPFRKDVTAKLYGGDRTRKDKLLEAQKKGKERMKMVGNVSIPQEAFLSVLRL